MKNNVLRAFFQPGMGGFERVDLPLPLLLQAADRRVRSSGAFGQREEPIHPPRPGTPLPPPSRAGDPGVGGRVETE